MTENTDIPVEYTRILEQEDRDVEGMRHPVGTPILCDPSAPHEFMKDSDRNRVRFRDAGYAWTREARQKAWFLDLRDLDRETIDRVNAARGQRERFGAAIHENLLAAVGAAFPQVPRAFCSYLLPFEWEPRVNYVREVADLTEAAARALTGLSGLPVGLEWPADWSGLLGSLIDVRVYAVGSWRRRPVHVLAAFVTRLRATKKAPPTVMPLDAEAIDVVRDVYRTWRDGQGLRAAPFLFLTVAGAETAAPSLEGVAGGNEWLMVSCWRDGQWDTRQPRRFGDRLAVQDFLDRLKPVTQAERVSRVKECVEGMIPEGGNVTVDKVAQRSGCRRCTVRGAFLALQEQSSDYRLYRTSAGEVAIRAAKPGEARALAAALFGRGFLRKHGLQLAGTAIGVGGWTLRSVLNLSGVLGFVALVLAVYATSCAQATLNRRASDKE